MKILAINGSHRGKGGITQRLLDKIAEGACESGGQFETIVLVDHKICHCIGCDNCHNPESRLHCIYEHQDDVKGIFEKMREADVIIYASPVYIFSISGIMKTFMDRLNSTVGEGGLTVTKSGLFFHRVDPVFHSKPFVVLTCCGNVEPETYKNVVSYFKTFAKFVDAPIVGTLIRTSVGMIENTDSPKSEKSQRAIAEVLDAYVAAGREIALQGRILPSTERTANQQIMGVPFLDIILRVPILKRMAIAKTAGVAEEDISRSTTNHDQE